MHDAPAPGDDACFVCDEAGSQDRGELLQMCGCKKAHGACKAGFRQLHAGTVHEVYCTECSSWHLSLPSHVCTDAAQGKHHVALVSLRLPYRRPVRCAVLSSGEGMRQLQTLAQVETGLSGPWSLSAYVQLPGTEEFAQLSGWPQWPWIVYCVASTQALHGLGRHWLELVRDVTEIRPNFSVL